MVLGYKCVEVGGNRWEWMGVEGSGWEWMGVEGSGWERGLVQPFN